MIPRSCSAFLRLSCILSLLVFELSTARGALVNVTVDDQNGDENTKALPVYSPAAAWSQGPSCSGCLAQPDPSLALDNTWHDATFAPGDPQYTIEVNFTGAAVYAFFIIANTVEFATTLTNLSFALDGSSVGTFVHAPTTSTQYEYNVPGYSNASLKNGDHTLVISAVGATNDSLVLFDYLVYSADEDSTTSTSSTSRTQPASPTTHLLSSSPTSASHQSTSTAATLLPGVSQSSPQGRISNSGGIIGGSVGGGLAVLLLFALVFCCIKRRKKNGNLALSVRNPFNTLDYRPSIAKQTGRPIRGNADFLSSTNQPTGRTDSLTVFRPVSNVNQTDLPSEALLDAPALLVPDLALRDEVSRYRDHPSAAGDVSRIEKVVSEPGAPSHVSDDSRMPNARSATPSEREGNEGVLRNQIARLQEQVNRLAAQHENLQLFDVGDEPPPGYDSTDRSGSESR